MKVYAQTQADPAPAKASGPFTADQAGPTLLMALVAMIGGLVSFYKKWKDGHVRAFNLVELIGEMFVSGVCGITAWWIFRGFGVNEWLTAAGVAIVGHMGTRAIFMAEQGIENLMKRKTGGSA